MTLTALGWMGAVVLVAGGLVLAWRSWGARRWLTAASAVGLGAALGWIAWLAGTSA